MNATENEQGVRSENFQYEITPQRQEAKDQTSVDNPQADSKAAGDSPLTELEVTPEDLNLTAKTINEMEPKEVISEDVIKDVAKIGNIQQRMSTISLLRRQAKRFGYERRFQSALNAYAKKDATDDEPVQDSTPLYKRAENVIWDFIKNNKSKFNTKSSNAPSDPIGRIERKIVRIDRDCLVNALSNAGICYDTVKRALVSDKFIIKPNSDHFHQQTTINNKRMDVVIVALPEELKD